MHTNHKYLNNTECMHWTNIDRQKKSKVRYAEEQRPWHGHPPLRNNTNWIKVWQDWVAIADTRWQAPPWVLFMFCAEFWARQQPGNRKDLLWKWQIENINRDFTNATDDNTLYCTELRRGWWPPVLIVHCGPGPDRGTSLMWYLNWALI